MNASFTEGLSFDENGSFFLHSDFKQDPFLMGSNSPQLATPLRRKPLQDNENARIPTTDKLKSKNNMIPSSDKKGGSPSMGVLRDLDMVRITFTCADEIRWMP
jgi:hypothetical protein